MTSKTQFKRLEVQKAQPSLTPNTDRLDLEREQKPDRNYESDYRFIARASERKNALLRARMEDIVLSLDRARHGGAAANLIRKALAGEST